MVRFRLFALRCSSSSSCDGREQVCFTQPHIGNVGINEGDMECGHGCHLSGVIVKHLSENVSNYRSVETLEDYLERQGVVGIAGVDTRQLTRVLREKGSLVGVVCTDSSISDEALVKQATEWSILGKDLLKEVTCKEPYVQCPLSPPHSLSPSLFR